MTISFLYISGVTEALVDSLLLLRAPLAFAPWHLACQHNQLNTECVSNSQESWKLVGGNCPLMLSLLCCGRLFLQSMYQGVCRSWDSCAESDALLLFQSL